MAPPELTAHLQAMAPHATNQLRLLDRTVAILKSLRSEDILSRTSSAATLKAIQAELGRIAGAFLALRQPTALAQAHAAYIESVQKMGSAVGELAVALEGDAGLRVKRIEVARERAAEAESLTRKSSAAFNAALGTVAAAAAGTPIVGPIIAAVLAAVAAVLVLIGQVLAKAKEDQAEEKEDKDDRERP